MLELEYVPGAITIATSAALVILLRCPIARFIVEKGINSAPVPVMSLPFGAT
jgi:hypothetical protein